LVTSQITHEEIKRYQGAKRPLVERTFRLLKKVPIVRWDELMGINSQVDKYTMINTPMIQNDPMYDKLLKLGVKTVDAKHVYVAAKNACPTLLTCDRGVLALGPKIATLCRVTVQKPSRFVAERGW